MNWLISQISYDDDEFSTHKMCIEEFCKLADVPTNNMYKEIKKITMKLIKRGLSINDFVENKLVQVTWLNSAVYHHNEGYVELRISSELQPYLLKIKDQFTSIDRSTLMGLNSIHAVRIFELLKQYEQIGKRTIPLTDLREYCGISTNQYERYSAFKEYVLEMAKKEINKKTDINIEFEEIKTGRKITSILFSIKQKTKSHSETLQVKKLEHEFASRSRLVEEICNYGFGKKTALGFFSIANEDEIKAALSSVNIQVQRGHVKNAKAMLRTAIKEKWRPEVYKPQVQK